MYLVSRQINNFCFLGISAVKGSFVWGTTSHDLESRTTNRYYFDQLRENCEISIVKLDFCDMQMSLSNSTRMALEWHKIHTIPRAQPLRGVL